MQGGLKCNLGCLIYKTAEILHSVFFSMWASLYTNLGECRCSSSKEEPMLHLDTSSEWQNIQDGRHCWPFGSISSKVDPFNIQQTLTMIFILCVLRFYAGSFIRTDQTNILWRFLADSHGWNHSSRVTMRVVVKLLASITIIKRLFPSFT